NRKSNYSPLRWRYLLAASGSTRFILFSRSLVSGRFTSGLLGPPPSPGLRTGSSGVGRVVLSSALIIICKISYFAHVLDSIRLSKGHSVRDMHRPAPAVCVIDHQTL